MKGKGKRPHTPEASSDVEIMGVTTPKSPPRKKTRTTFAEVPVPATPSPQRVAALKSEV